MLHDLVWATAYDALLAVHDGAHQSVFCRHKSLLQVKGLVVPGDDATPQLVALADAQSPAVPDGGGAHDHRGLELSQCLEHTVAHVEGEAGKVALAQVTSIVHVAHVDVAGRDAACEGLLRCYVPHHGLEPGPEDHKSCPQEVPHIQGAEEQQQDCEHNQQPPHLSGKEHTGQEQRNAAGLLQAKEDKMHNPKFTPGMF